MKSHSLVEILKITQLFLFLVFTFNMLGQINYPISTQISYGVNLLTEGNFKGEQYSFQNHIHKVYFEENSPMVNVYLRGFNGKQLKVQGNLLRFNKEMECLYLL